MAHASLEPFSPCPSWTLVSSSVNSLSARPAGGLHCTIARQGLLDLFVTLPTLGVSPLFFFFVPTEGEAMRRNRLVLLVSFVACPQSGLGPVGTACIPQGPGLQTSAEASCLVCSSVPGKPCHTQPGPLWVHPVSAAAICLGAVGSGQICGCAVNLSSFLEGSWWLRRKEEPQNVKPSSGCLTWLLITAIWNEEEAFDFLACQVWTVFYWSPDPSLLVLLKFSVIGATLGESVHKSLSVREGLVSAGVSFRCHLPRAEGKWQNLRCSPMVIATSLEIVLVTLPGCHSWQPAVL